MHYDFFKVKAEENDLQLVKKFVSLNRGSGVVKRKNGGGEIKMFGCKSFMHMWGIYKQSVNGKEPEEREHKKIKKASKGVCKLRCTLFRKCFLCIFSAFLYIDFHFW